MKQKTYKGHATFGFSSSKGFLGIKTKENVLFCFQTDTIRTINTIEDIRNWLVNNLSVYSPVEIKYTEEDLSIEFHIENIRFTAKRLSRDDECSMRIHEKLPEELLVVSDEFK